MTPKEVLKLIEEQNVKFVDLRFTDFFGLWQHCSYPASMFDEDTFEDGLGFDGSSIRGWQVINNSDMLIIPDPTTAKLDPFTQIPTLIMLCKIVDPITKEPYSRDPRNIALKGEKYLQSTGIADTAYFGPEAEFFIFDDVRYACTPNESFYFFDSIEGEWNTGRDESPNLGYKIRHKEGYFPVPPHDSLMDIRADMALAIENLV